MGGLGLWEEVRPAREAWLESGPCMGRARLPAVMADESLARTLLWKTESTDIEKVFKYKPVLDQARAKRGLEPADTTAGRLFKRARPTFLSEAAGDDGGRFHARPAARPPIQASAAVTAAADSARKRARDARIGRRDGKGLGFGAGLASRATVGVGGSISSIGRSAKPLPTTLVALQEVARKDQGEFAKIMKENPRLLEQLERKAAAASGSVAMDAATKGRVAVPPPRQAGGAAMDPRRAADPRRDPRRRGK